jgi:hypothetical protein
MFKDKQLRIFQAHIPDSKFNIADGLRSQSFEQMYDNYNFKA